MAQVKDDKVWTEALERGSDSKDIVGQFERISISVTWDKEKGLINNLGRQESLTGKKSRLWEST